jgi:hypothetical protein
MEMTENNKYLAGLIEQIDLWADPGDELGEIPDFDHDLIRGLRESMESAVAQLKSMGY